MERKTVTDVLNYDRNRLNWPMILRTNGIAFEPSSFPNFSGTTKVSITESLKNGKENSD
jgi:hypothetical protein